ncbi:hypothetical protein TNCT_319141 [Trichonephila clavata]|uniref:Uncharacterized protein n=1 Tax=Trichonephila clavata TaxID=2740835 RepID=A0A8X6K8F3_TRICU|nr:hypothetical protein TNCT_319141 [Trichonephila clavata]
MCQPRPDCASVHIEGQEKGTVKYLGRLRPHVNARRTQTDKKGTRVVKLQGASRARLDIVHRVSDNRGREAKKYSRGLFIQENGMEFFLGSSGKRNLLGDFLKLMDEKRERSRKLFLYS